MKTIELDLGCGKNKNNDSIGIDISRKTDADIVSNIEHGLPLKNNVSNRIYANHCLEHIDNFKFVMKEIWRTLKPKGKVLIRVPHYSHPGAFSDFTHKRFFGVGSFNYFGENWYDYYTDFKFNVIKTRLIYQKDNFIKYKKIYPLYLLFRIWGWLIQRIADINPKETERFIGFLGFKEIFFELEAIK